MATDTLDNPATQKSLAVPPALIEAVQEDPEVLVKLTRSQLVVLQDRMVRKVLADENATVGQMAAVHERLSKNARVEAKEAGGAAGGGPTVVINFHRHAGRETVTIDAAPSAPPLEVKDAAPA